jgi:Zn-dependent peptidase ImmA (M78 family)/O-acetyl-ADP-ribose deacetylase (regulator of RNase III)
MVALNSVTSDQKRMKKTPYWTNNSVIKFAGEIDPVEAIADKARSLVLDYIEQTAETPPFNPFDLAKFLKIQTIPTENVQDARTRFTDRGFVLEFNPNRAPARIRFSIAHEIAHTFFPDCKEAIRNRATHAEMSADEWQLEMLCNIAAGEILMPAGTFSELKSEKVPIEAILDLQKRFQVSIESLLRRFVHLTEDPCVLFSASKDWTRKGNYRVDYSVGSRTSSIKISQGTEIPERSVVEDCTAIGFTSRGQEKWPGMLELYSIECVGIPGFPGQILPRVMGLVRPSKPIEVVTKNISFVRGDATQPRTTANKVIAFVVNDSTPNWGAGFALEIKKKWPEVQRDFARWVAAKPTNLTLGRIFVTEVDAKTTVIPMIAQHGYGPSRKPRIRYAALQQCLKALSHESSLRDSTVHMPRIGAGQAGGNWSVIEELIGDILLTSGIDVTVYDLPNQRKRKSEQQSLNLFGQ